MHKKTTAHKVTGSAGACFLRAPTVESQLAHHGVCQTNLHLAARMKTSLRDAVCASISLFALAYMCWSPVPSGSVAIIMTGGVIRHIAHPTVFNFVLPGYSKTTYSI